MMLYFNEYIPNQLFYHENSLTFAIIHSLHILGYFLELVAASWLPEGNYKNDENSTFSM